MCEYLWTCLCDHSTGSTRMMTTLFFFTRSLTIRPDQTRPNQIRSDQIKQRSRIDFDWTATDSCGIYFVCLCFVFLTHFFFVVVLNCCSCRVRASLVKTTTAVPLLLLRIFFFRVRVFGREKNKNKVLAPVHQGAHRQRARGKR